MGGCLITPGIKARTSYSRLLDKSMDWLGFVSERRYLNHSTYLELGSRCSKVRRWLRGI
jgi:hypothetical protein